MCSVLIDCNVHKAKPLQGFCPFLNKPCLLRSYMWVDDDTIGAVVIPEGRAPPPEKPPIPIGPNIQDNSSGRISQACLLPLHSDAAAASTPDTHAKTGGVCRKAAVLSKHPLICRLGHTQIC